MGCRRLLHRIAGTLLIKAQSFNSHAEEHGFKTALRKAFKTLLSYRTSKTALQRGETQAKPEHWSLVDAREYPDLTPIPTFPVTAEAESFTSVVTDSIGPSSLFGGVGTALLLATLLANRRGQPLRIITRTEQASAEAYGSLIKTHGLELDGELVLSFAPAGSDRPVVSQHPDDLFITTSWWTTSSCLERLAASQILYLLQEDERYFYPHGDQRLLCEKILQSPQIRFVVNSRFLWDHFGQTGPSSIQTKGVYFEPCFTVQRHSLASSSRPGDKKVFFFYARPSNPRNLYRTGMQAINDALCTKVLDSSMWEIVLAGRGLEPICFDEGTVPRLVEGLSWNDYLSLLKTVDLGLSLMATPHPSYPPLDLAASGAVVVTNKFANKTSLLSYSENIICCDPYPDAILEGLKLAVERVDRPEEVQSAIQRQSFCQSWLETFEPLLEQFSHV